MVGIETSTVRKYGQALEAAGYIIERDASGKRIYSDMDAMVFQQLKAIRTNANLSVENSAKVVAAKHIEATGSVSPVAATQEVQQYDERHTQGAEALFKMIGSIAENMKKMSEELEEQRKINQQLHERQLKQNLQISEVLREVLETKRLMLNDTVQQRKERKWYEFWKRGEEE